MKLTIEDKEIRKIFKNIDKYKKDVAREVETVLVKNTQMAQADARKNILVDTGLARRSTTVKYDRKADDGKFVNEKGILADVTKEVHILFRHEGAR